MTNHIKLILLVLGITLILSGCSTKPEVVVKTVYLEPKKYEFQKLDFTGAYIELNEYTMKNVRIDRNKFIVSNSSNPVLYGVIDHEKNEILFTPKGIQRLATTPLLELDDIFKGTRTYYEWQFDEAMKEKTDD